MSKDSLSASSASAKFRDYFVAFLGSLLPGLLFLLLLLPTVVLPLLTVTQGHYPRLCDDILARPVAVYHDIGYQLLGASFLLVLAYVLGFGFYRQDPKLPDTLSWQLHGEDDGPAGEIPERVRAARPKTAWGRVWWWYKPLLYWLPLYHQHKIEYPYLSLQRYLSTRALPRLSVYVTWDASSATARTKHAINALKIALGVYCSGTLGTVAQNEAHLRLSSSVWYSCKAITRTSFLSIPCTIVATALAASDTSRSAYAALVAVVWVVLTLAYLFVGWLSWTILGAFHYQRVREILWVLQTVDCASVANADLANYLRLSGVHHSAAPRASRK
jgi:hypothetical protein